MEIGWNSFNLSKYQNITVNVEISFNYIYCEVRFFFSVVWAHLSSHFHTNCPISREVPRMGDMSPASLLGRSIYIYFSYNILLIVTRTNFFI